MSDCGLIQDRHFVPWTHIDRRWANLKIAAETENVGMDKILYAMKSRIDYHDRLYSSSHYGNQDKGGTSENHLLNDNNLSIIILIKSDLI